MAIPLTEARTAAERGDWWRILGLDYVAGLSDVQESQAHLAAGESPRQGR